MYFLLLCLCILIVCLYIFIVPAGTLRLPWLRFFRAFSSVVRQMPGYNPQRRGTARILPKFLCCSIYCSFCVLFVCKCVLYYHHRVATQLQLTNISYHHHHNDHHYYHYGKRQNSIVGIVIRQRAGCSGVLFLAAAR
jgi:hypothetical protein